LLVAKPLVVQAVPSLPVAKPLVAQVVQVAQWRRPCTCP